MNKTIALVAMAVLIMAPSTLAEDISYTWNSVSDTDDHVPADYGASVMFTAGTVNVTDVWNWSVNGVVRQSGTNASYNASFSSFAMHNVSVNGSGAYGVTPDHIWSVICQRELADGSVETFADHSGDMEDSISGEPDFEAFCRVIATPYTSVFGSIFYLFIFGTPMLMLYIRQDDLATPMTIVFLFGSVILFMLPAQWQAIGGAIMVLGLIGALFRIFKERER